MGTERNGDKTRNVDIPDYAAARHRATRRRCSCLPCSISLSPSISRLRWPSRRTKPVESFSATHPSSRSPALRGIPGQVDESRRPHGPPRLLRRRPVLRAAGGADAGTSPPTREVSGTAGSPPMTRRLLNLLTLLSL
jgi:hypothetical protein